MWISGITAIFAVFVASVYRPEKWIWLVLTPFLITAVLSWIPFIFIGVGDINRNYYFGICRQFIGSYLIPASLIFFIIHLLMFSVKSLSQHVVSREQYYYVINAALFFIYAVSLIGFRVFLKNRYPVPGVDYQ
jgi:uncharacterized membrane protein